MDALRIAVTSLVMLALFGACGGATRPASSPAPAARATPTELETLRAKGTVVVSLRVEAPRGGRTPQDPAHAQKRAFEEAVARLVIGRAFGPAVKVELKGVGGADRIGAVQRGEADAAMEASAQTPPAGIAFSAPYARGGIVLAAPAGSAVRAPADLRGRTVAVAQDELRARAVADEILKQAAPDAKVLDVLGVSGAIEAVDSGKADALIGDSIGLALVAKDRPGRLALVSELAPRGYVIAVRAGTRDLIEAIDAALRELLAGGEIGKAAAAAGFPWEAPR